MKIYLAKLNEKKKRSSISTFHVAIKKQIKKYKSPNGTIEKSMQNAIT